MGTRLMKLVLVIDDDPVIRAVVRQVLERDGFSVEAADNAQSGLIRFAELNPDLVIIDIMMPGKEGMETILEMREANPDACILAMTGGGGNSTAGNVLHMAELLGADNTLKKPFAPAALLDTVKRCLKP